MAAAITPAAPSRMVLLAGKHGPLVGAFAKLDAAPDAEMARTAIEELLVTGKRSRDGAALLLFNLSRTSAAETFRAVLRSVIEHPGWQRCDGCRGQLPDRESRCPIWEN